MKLEPLGLDVIEQVREWRHQAMETLRTPYFLTQEMQEEYYRNVICNRNSNTRYFALYVDDEFVGYGGIENIEWENSRGEISVLIGPEYRGKGYGKEAVKLFIDHGFNMLNLKTIWGCVYECGNVEFWRHVLKDYHVKYTYRETLKYYQGKYWGALFFDIIRSTK